MESEVPENLSGEPTDDEARRQFPQNIDEKPLGELSLFGCLV